MPPERNLVEVEGRSKKICLGGCNVKKNNNLGGQHELSHKFLKNIERFSKFLGHGLPLPSLGLVHAEVSYKEEEYSHVGHSASG